MGEYKNNRIILNCKDKFDKLVELFVYRNNRVNLSSIRDIEWIRTKHIEDSLIIFSDEFLNKFPKLNLFFEKNLKSCDVWTGWWFPLLPLAICKSNWKFVWIDSRKKKIDILKDIVNKLGLSNVKLVWSRAEEFNQEKFDLVTARAVAYITKLLPWVSHLVRSNGYLILYKKVSEEEYYDLKKVISKYNFELDWYYDYKLFKDDILRRIYILRKK